MQKLYDMHMHTRFSGDSEANPYDMIAAAKAKGLSGLIFTDHEDLDYWGEPHLFDLDLETYIPTMKKIAQETSTDDFSVGVGIELGLQEHLVKEHTSIIEGNDFDFVIGSIHQVYKKDPYYDSYYEGRSVDEALTDYLECTLRNLEVFHNIDTLGHLDYVVRYASRFMNKRIVIDVAKYKDILEAIFQLLIKNNICLEVNTGGYRHGLPEPNPSIELLTFYRDLGGHLLTLGADAHKPEDVAIQFEAVPDLLKSIGFQSITHFTSRRGTEIGL
ncbi:MAG: histidinol-phosphatase HisJ family protein [Lachnospiraceae bacterium]|nr:histidinol-phosphatase HisJ family protein [Lachnospiraceae bacterium]